MTSRYAYFFMALAAVLALVFITLSGVQAEDTSSNGVLMPTTLHLSGSSDDLKLWPQVPPVSSEGNSVTTEVSEQQFSGYVPVGTWETEPLDKDLHVEGDVTVVLFINSTEDDGPDVRFQIQLFGETYETGYYGTNTGVSRVSVSFQVNGWDGALDSSIALDIQVDAEDAIGGGNKEVTVHFWNMSRDSVILFDSDATDISIEPSIVEDGNGVKYFRIYVNITDAFEDMHIDLNSFTLNITHKNEPHNYTAQATTNGLLNPEFLTNEDGQYWSSIGYTAWVFHWYYEGRDYTNDVEGQWGEAGDYWMRFTLNDTEENHRFINHLEIGVNPTYVHVNVHTDDEYITVVDYTKPNPRDVPEVAAHDEVQVRVLIELNKGNRDATYQFYVEFRVDGSLPSEESRVFVQMEGKSSKKLFFPWDPEQGTHTLSIDVDSDNDIDEIDESDNDVSTEVEVIAVATPDAIISHPMDGGYVNSDVYILFDASNSTNPLSGDMEFSWTIQRWEENSWVTKTNFANAWVVSNKLLGKSYGYGLYRAVVRVENDKRSVERSVEFTINIIPTIDRISPEENEIYSSKDPIQFDASESFDDDGDTLYFWWFSEISGVLSKTEGITDYSMASFERTLPGGIHNITLEVYDYDPNDNPGEGERKGMAVDTFVIIVNTPPRIEVISPLDGLSYSAQDEILFDATRSEDPDGDELIFTWMDGNKWMSSDASFQEKLSAGPHTIKLEVSDGLTDVEYTLNIMVGSPPVAKTSESKKASLDGSKAKVSLDASESTPVDETVPIVKYYWDRDINVDSSGDNITDNDIDYESADPTITLEYTKKGTYTAQLTVEDQAGVVSQPYTFTVTIEEEESDDTDFAIIGGIIAVIAMIAIGGFILYQRMYDDDDDDDEYDEEEYEDEFEDAEEYEAEYY